MAGKGILIISPVFPSRETEGRSMRLAGWIRSLTAEGPVYLVVVSPNHQIEPADMELWGLTGCYQVTDVKSPRLIRFLMRIFPFLAAFRPDWTRAARNANKDELRELSGKLCAAPIGRLLVFRINNHSWGSALADVLDIKEREMDLDDWDRQTSLSIAGLLLKMGKPLKAASYLSLAIQYYWLEVRWLPFYRRVYLACPTDAEQMAELFPNIQWECFPNRITGQMIPVEQTGECRRILFTGNMGYPPNIEAVQWFARKVMKRLRETDERWVFTVVGRGAPQSLARYLKGLPGVDFRGEVPEMLPFYGEAMAVVVPLHGGGGTKFKTLEAFKVGKPVVSTLEGVRGLRAVDGQHFLTAEEPEEWVEALQRLVTDSKLRKSLADNAQKLLVQENLIAK